MVAGEEVTVHLLKAGKEAGQAVAYLEDGSMVVVEHAREHIGEDREVTVTSVVTTANGRLVFGRLGGSEPAPARRRTEPPPRPGPVPSSA